MAREVWRDSADNEAASAVFHFVQQLIDRFSDNRPVMPLVVLQAADADVPYSWTPGSNRSSGRSTGPTSRAASR